MNNKVDIKDKYALTLEEAAIYFNIGINKIRELTKVPDIKYVIKIGSKTLIKRELFEKYLDNCIKL